MAKERPAGFVDYTKVLNVIERSLDSAIDFAEKTDEVFYNIETITEKLNSLRDLVVELYWRYGGNVMFCFTQKHTIEGALPLNDVIGKTEEYTEWENRVLINESTKSFSKVYIRF